MSRAAAPTICNTYFSYTQVALCRPPVAPTAPFVTKICRFALDLIVLIGSILADCILAPLNLAQNLCYSPARRNIPPVSVTIPQTTPPAGPITPHRLLQNPLLNQKIVELLQLPPASIKDSREFVRNALQAALRHHSPESAAKMRRLFNQEEIDDTFNLKQWVGACVVIQYFLHREFDFREPSDVEHNYSFGLREPCPMFIEGFLKKLGIHNTEEKFFSSLTLREKASVVLRLQVPDSNEAPLPPQLQAVVDQIRQAGSELPFNLIGLKL